MAKQDNWVRITVRIPPELHQRLLESCTLDNRSLNAEMVERLENSFDYEREQHINRDLREEMRLARLNVELLQAAIEMPSREEILKRMKDRKLEPMSPEGYQAYLIVTSAKERAAGESQPLENIKNKQRPQKWK